MELGYQYCAGGMFDDMSRVILFNYLAELCQSSRILPIQQNFDIRKQFIDTLLTSPMNSDMFGYVQTFSTSRNFEKYIYYIVSYW